MFSSGNQEGSRQGMIILSKEKSLAITEIDTGDGSLI
jgi:hypothetical protein